MTDDTQKNLDARARDRRAYELFIEAIDLHPDERTPYVREKCGTDQLLLKQITMLLQSHEETSETNLTDAAKTQKSPMIGKEVGRYTIRRVLGEGGMGVVYEAIQKSPRRTVALKMIRQNVTSRSALRRFEYEAQTLGRLQHEGIAHIFEADTWDEEHGPQPWFAMEYIIGAKTLIKYCDDKKMGTRARLELFQQICSAVQHGHSKGIIHRDLKPSNILVTANGVAKIIDFGVARSIDSDLAVTTLQTDIGALIGTMQYMSPEQCDGDPNAIDTRSDVYALGVILYEMLCGKLPYDVRSKALHEAARMVREEAPTRPSTLDKKLRGDLEVISLKALEKDRDRRYQSTLDLEQDITRYLAGDSIMAKRASGLEQVLKFSKRHKSMASAVTAIFLVTIFAATIAQTSYYKALEAEKRTAAAERSNALTSEALAKKEDELKNVKLENDDSLAEIKRQENDLNRAIKFLHQERYINYMEEARTARDENDFASAHQALLDAALSYKRQKIGTGDFKDEDVRIKMQASKDAMLAAGPTVRASLRDSHLSRGRTVQQISQRSFLNIKSGLPVEWGLLRNSLGNQIQTLEVTASQLPVVFDLAPRRPHIVIAQWNDRYGLFIGIFDIQSGELIRKFFKETVGIKSTESETPLKISYSPCGDHIAWISDKGLKVWDLQSDTAKTRSLDQEEEIDVNLAWSDTGNEIIWSKIRKLETRLRAWFVEVLDKTNLELITEIRSARKPSEISFDSHKNHLTLWFVDGSSHRFEANPVRMIDQTYPVLATTGILGAFTVNTKNGTLAGFNFYNGTATLNIWKSRGNQDINEIPKRVEGWLNDVNFKQTFGSFSLNKNSSQIAYNMGTKITVVDVERGLLNKELTGLRAREIKFSEDGRFLAASNNGMVKIWSLDDAIHEKNSTKTNWRNDSVSSLTASLDGKLIAVGHESGQIEIINGTTHQNMVTFEADGVNTDSQIVESLAFNRDASYLVSLTSDWLTTSIKLCIWDLRKGQKVTSWETERDIQNVAFDRVKNTILTLSKDAYTRWDISSGKVIEEFQREIESSISAQTTTHSATVLVKSKEENSFEIVDLTNNDTLKRITIPTANVSLKLGSELKSISPDGRFLKIKTRRGSQGGLQTNFWNEETNRLTPAESNDNFDLGMFNSDGTRFITHQEVRGNLPNIYGMRSVPYVVSFLKFWDTDTGKCVATELVVEDKNATITQMAFDHTELRIILGFSNGTVKVLDAKPKWTNHKNREDYRNRCAINDETVHKWTFEESNSDDQVLNKLEQWCKDKDPLIAQEIRNLTMASLARRRDLNRRGPEKREAKAFLLGHLTGFQFLEKTVPNLIDAYLKLSAQDREQLKVEPLQGVLELALRSNLSLAEQDPYLWHLQGRLLYELGENPQDAIECIHRGANLLSTTDSLEYDLMRNDILHIEEIQAIREKDSQRGDLTWINELEPVRNFRYQVSNHLARAYELLASDEKQRIKKESDLNATTELVIRAIDSPAGESKHHELWHFHATLILDSNPLDLELAIFSQERAVALSQNIVRKTYFLEVLEEYKHTLRKQLDINNQAP